MKITVNNEIKIISNSSLHVLLESLLGEKTKGIAIAINQNIIQKNNWSTTSLKEGDAILIIKATQGG
ncbi:MAG: thiamine biosynthesis protein ThiS [Bacteroidetes bacterium]|nr:thiamine biosynthesis protein ThiS [Bacteroidota bacterium]